VDIHMYRSCNPNEINQLVSLMGFWNTNFILTRRRANRVGIKLKVTPRDIPKIDFVIALNRTLNHSPTPLRR
jgi:hypothetical protein